MLIDHFLDLLSSLVRIHSLPPIPGFEGQLVVLLVGLAEFRIELEELSSGVDFLHGEVPPIRILSGKDGTALQEYKR